MFLDTKSWKREETRDLDEIQAAAERLVSHFRQQLEAKCVNFTNLQDQLEEIVMYARKYLNCEGESYQWVWYKLCTSPSEESKWPSILQLSQLVFSLPFSNSHVEQLFSTLKWGLTLWGAVKRS